MAASCLAAICRSPSVRDQVHQRLCAAFAKCTFLLSTLLSRSHGLHAEWKKPRWKGSEFALNCEKKQISSEL